MRPNHGKLICIVFVITSIHGMLAMGDSVVNFDSVFSGTNLSGSHYAGLTWGWGNSGYEGNLGYWEVYNNGYNPPVLSHPVINAWGCSLLGIGFPTQVNVSGAYFAGQGNPSVYTAGVRVHGYQNGIEIACTPLLTGFTSFANPKWFAMNLYKVDSILIEFDPRFQRRGMVWYG